MAVELAEIGLKEARTASTTGSPGCPAREKVLCTCELLEQILLHLPLRDLIKAQRVDRTFKSVFDGSPGIQQALFLAPMPGPNVIFHEIVKPVDGGNPWRMKWTRETEIEDSIWIAGPSMKLVRQPLLNPFLNPYIDQGFHAEEGHPWAHGASTALDLRHKFVVPDRHENPALTRASTSLQRMLPTQPAIRSSIYECGHACDYNLRITPIDPGGAKGHLIIADFKRTLSRHSFLCPTCKGVSRSWAWDGNKYVDMVESGTRTTGFEMLAELEGRTDTEASSS